MPNQSYLAKADAEYRMAAAIGAILFDLGVQAKPRDGSWLPGGNPNDVTWYPTAWRIDKEIFYYRPNWGGGGGNAYVQFSNARFDPTRGNIWRGREESRARMSYRSTMMLKPRSSRTTATARFMWPMRKASRSLIRSLQASPRE